MTKPPPCDSKKQEQNNLSTRIVACMHAVPESVGDGKSGETCDELAVTGRKDGEQGGHQDHKVPQHLKPHREPTVHDLRCTFIPFHSIPGRNREKQK